MNVTSNLTEILSAFRDMEADDDPGSPISEMDAIKKGPEGVPEDILPVLLLFCAAYSHLLVVLDDEEFYELQVLFAGPGLVSTCLNP